jgi:hypothetical protein
MATVTDMRAWLRAERPDLGVGDRGRLTAEQTAVYEEAHGVPGAGAEYDAGVSDADFDEREPDTPMQPERRPRTQRDRRDEARTASRRTRSDRLVGRLLGGSDDGPKAKGKTTARKRIPRVPVDHLISRVWEGMARVAGTASMPVSRCLQVQSPVAGMILEDVISGTVVDRALQPLARAEEKAEKVIALLGPPLLVAAIESTAALPPEQAAMRQAILIPLLKESLRVWLEVAGPKVEEAARREADYQNNFGRTIDELLNLFFGNVTMTAEATAPETAGAAA